MIHSVVNHRKFKRLVRLIRDHCEGSPVTPESVCVSLLERLWHATIANARRGDIGRLTDDDIAEEIGWLGDPALLIDALVESRWLERCDQYRLVVHDWPDHAPNFIKGNIAKHQSGWATSQGTLPKQPARENESEVLPKQPAQGNVLLAPSLSTLPKQHAQGTLPPNLTKLNPTKPPPPTSSEGAAPNGKSTPNWVEVEGDLFTAGVAMTPAAIDSAKRHGCPPDLVRACVEHWHAQQPGWDAGSLYTRIMQLRPGQDPELLWPPKSRPLLSPDERRTSEDAKRKQQAGEAARIQAELAADEKRVAGLEDRYGDAIDMLDQQGLVELIEAAEPDNPEFHVKRLMRSGVTATLRLVLLEHLAKEVQS